DRHRRRRSAPRRVDLNLAGIVQQRVEARAAEHADPNIAAGLAHADFSFEETFESDFEPDGFSEVDFDPPLSGFDVEELSLAPAGSFSFFSFLSCFALSREPRESVA